MKKILLLSAYDALSHRYWREGLVANFPEYDWTVLTLPPRYFRWRIRGNSLTWSFSERDVLSQKFDLVIATSMTDFATLRGLVPSLAEIPSIVYFHENQFAYPEGDHKQLNVEAKMVTLYSALAATKVVFNTDYNRQTFFQGINSFLDRMPDGVPTGVGDHIVKKSIVLPVPLHNPEENKCSKNKQSSLTILWNHRWEYDKAPERFLKALLELETRGIDFKLNMLGQQFRNRSELFDQIKERLSDHILHWGFVEDENEYRTIIQQSDVVVSTALHDFQGLSVLEAVAYGCVPVVPDRLAYAELFADQFRYVSYIDDEEKEVEELANRLEKLSVDFKQNKLNVSPDMSALYWTNLKEMYQYEFFS